MPDTKLEMIQKQRDIFFSKTPNERFLIGVDVIAFGRTMVESSIIQKNPGISESDLKVAVFKRYYANTFSRAEFEKIINSMEYYYLHKTN